jgi:hypothetical protein
MLCPVGWGVGDVMMLFLGHILNDFCSYDYRYAPSTLKNIKIRAYTAKSRHSALQNIDMGHRSGIEGNLIVASVADDSRVISPFTSGAARFIPFLSHPLTSSIDDVDWAPR